MSIKAVYLSYFMANAFLDGGRLPKKDTSCGINSKLKRAWDGSHCLGNVEHFPLFPRDNAIPETMILWHPETGMMPNQSLDKAISCDHWPI